MRGALALPVVTSLLGSRDEAECRHRWNLRGCDSLVDVRLRLD
jgi:hypothetical protein